MRGRSFLAWSLFGLSVAALISFVLSAVLGTWDPRHAPGAAAEVRLGSDADGIRFVIHDEGPGFDVSSTDAGEGMQIMNDRIAALAGELVIDSIRGRGTTVTGLLPTRPFVGTHP